MNILLRLAKSSRLLVASALAASLVNGLLVSRIIALMNQAVYADRALLLGLGLRFFAFSLGMLAFRWFALAQFVRLSQRVLAQLRLHVSRFVTAAPYASIEARGPARVLAVLTEDVGTVGESFMLLPWLLVHGVVVLGCLGYLLILSVQVFLLVLCLLLLGSLRYARGARLAYGHLRRAREAEDDLFSVFRALFAGAKELRLHSQRRSAFVAGPLTQSTEQVRAARTRGLLIHTALANWRMFLFFAAIGGVTFALGPALSVSEEVRSGYALTLLYLMLPVNSLLEATPALSRMRVALERIQQIGVGTEPIAPLLEDEARAPRGTFRSLELSAVRHQYRTADDERVFTLGPISLTLWPSEIVFVVGGNGSGKTTLAKLLVGLYEPDAGEIRFNGVPVTGAEREAHRQRFAVVFYDFHLFESLPRAFDAELDARASELLSAFHLDHKVSIRDGAFSTTALSSGQRKRLALLLAVLEDRPICIFDEWAADQDPIYKEIFYRQILPQLRARGKCVVVISHDDRYFHLADRCLKLEDGLLTDSTHSVALHPERSTQGDAGGYALASAGER